MISKVTTTYGDVYGDSSVHYDFGGESRIYTKLERFLKEIPATDFSPEETDIIKNLGLAVTEKDKSKINKLLAGSRSFFGSLAKFASEEVIKQILDGKFHLP